MSLFRKRDFAFLGILLITLYISIDNNNLTYFFEPAWYIDQRNYNLNIDKTLLPIITDIDGNGEKEIVLITNNFELKIFSGNTPSSSGNDIYVPVEKASHKLFQNNSYNYPHNKFPAALNTGYITHYTNNKDRQQVIVLVRDDLSVTCFDSSLNILWEKQLAHKLHDIPGLLDHYQIQDIHIRMVPLRITENTASDNNDSDGCVIIGVSMVPKDRNSEDRIKLENGMFSTDSIDNSNTSVENNNKDNNSESSGEQDSRKQQQQKKEHVGINLQSQLEHFTMYALNGQNGQILWRHDGTAVQPEQYIRSLPQHAYKLNVGAEIANKIHKSHSHGMNDWTVFRQSLLAELPHYWHEKYDTDIRIAHFVRRHLGAGAGNQINKPQLLSKSKNNQAPSINSGSSRKQQETNTDSTHTLSKQKLSSSSSSKTSNSKNANNNNNNNMNKFNLQDLGRFTGIESPPLSLSASLPHDALEHTENPNVLVAHTSQGVEVISLRTGVPITALALNKEHVYADIDGDGIIDTISVLETQNDVAKHSITMIHDNENLQHCMIIVTSGLPPQSQLFNGTLCQNKRHLHDPIYRYKKGISGSNQYTGSSGGGGSNIIPSSIKAAQPVIFRSIDPKTLIESKRRDVVIAVNHGVLTCYSGVGEFRWQVDNTPTWALDFKYYYEGLYDTNARRVEEVGTVDNFKANIIVVGDKSFSLVSREGVLLTVTDLPAAPRTRPVIGDFNNDGYADIILLTDDVILGYRLEVTESINYMFLAILLLTAIAILCFIMNIRTLDNSSDEDEDNSKRTSNKNENILTSGIFESVSSQSSSSSNISLNATCSTNRPTGKYKKSILTLLRSTDEFHID